MSAILPQPQCAKYSAFHMMKGGCHKATAFHYIYSYARAIKAQMCGSKHQNSSGNHNHRTRLLHKHSPQHLPSTIQNKDICRPSDDQVLVKYTHTQTEGIEINSLAPGAFDYSLKLVNFKLISTINILSIFCEIAIRWTPQHLSDQ